MRWDVRLYLWAAERLYHELAWAYELVAWWVSCGRWSAWRRRVLRHVAGQRVLELGYGSGALLAELQQRGLQVWGLELSPQMQRLATIRLRRQGIWVPRVQARAQALPFADASFDTLLAAFPSNYILDPLTLSEVARVLRSSGRLVIGGAYLVDRRPLWRALGFRSHSATLLSRCARVADGAGLELRLVDEGEGRVSAPVLVLEVRHVVGARAGDLQHA